MVVLGESWGAKWFGLRRLTRVAVVLGFVLIGGILFEVLKMFF